MGDRVSVEPVGPTRGLDWEADWQRARDEIRELSASLRTITTELGTLVQKEVALARAEVGESVAAVRKAALFGAVAGVLAVIAIGFLGLAATFGLSAWLPLWGASLVTAGVLLVVTAGCAMLAVGALGDFSLMPKRTMHSLKEDLQWARQQISRSAK